MRFAALAPARSPLPAARWFLPRKNVELITGENWLRVLEQVQGGRCDDGRENDRDERHRRGRREWKPAAIAPEAHASAGEPHPSCCC